MNLFGKENTCLISLGKLLTENYLSESTIESIHGGFIMQGFHNSTDTGDAHEKGRESEENIPKIALPTFVQGNLLRFGGSRQSPGLLAPSFWLSKAPPSSLFPKVSQECFARHSLPGFCIPEY